MIMVDYKNHQPARKLNQRKYRFVKVAMAAAVTVVLFSLTLVRIYQ